MVKERFSITGKLDVPTQLNVARRLFRVVPFIDPIARPDNRDKPKAILVIMMLGQLSDEDSNYVINKCLKVVSVNQNGVLSKLQTSDGVLMFDDVSLDEICELVAEVILDNLGDFIHTALSGLT